MRIEMISTGDEIMTGFIADTNAVYFASRLLEAGLTLRRHSSAGDDLPELIRLFRERGAEADAVLVNGGLGPTSDDLTAEAAAAAAGVGLAEYPECLGHLRKWAESRGIELAAGNLKQALLPAGSRVIPNPSGTACGFARRIGRALFFFTPGVPYEYRAMLDGFVLPELKALAGAAPGEGGVSVRRFFTFGIAESELGDRIGAESLPESVKAGYRAGPGFIEVKITGNGASPGEMDRSEAIVRRCAGDCLVGAGGEDAAFAALRDPAVTGDGKILILDLTGAGKLAAYAAKYLPGNAACVAAAAGLRRFLTEKLAGEAPAAGFRRVLTAEADATGRNVTFEFADVDNNKGFKRKLHYRGLRERKDELIPVTALDLLRRYFENRDTLYKYPHFEDL